jgi:DNA-binding NarL/FixJ family response regulator
MKPFKQVTVLLADDNAPIRQGLRALLDRDRGIRVVGEARNGREAVGMARTSRPQVILMDISMPIINGLEATRQILAERPGTRVIVLSAHVEDEYVERAKAVGAVGYVAKQMSDEGLAGLIHDVSAGRSLWDPVRSADFAGGKGLDNGRGGVPKANARRLTFRESEVLVLLAGGLLKTQIAARLRTTIPAVEKHYGEMMAKLSVRSIAKLVAYAVASVSVENDVDLVIT